MFFSSLFAESTEDKNYHTIYLDVVIDVRLIKP